MPESLPQKPPKSPKMEKEEIELASDKSASDIEITVEELLDFGIDVDQVIQRRC